MLLCIITYFIAKSRNCEYGVLIVASSLGAGLAGWLLTSFLHTVASASDTPSLPWLGVLIGLGAQLGVLFWALKDKPEGC